MKTIHRLSLFCGVKLIFLIIISFFSLLALAPDEAQYWTWSQVLDLGYYSKPPAISWQIFLTTSLFGNNEVGVRIGAMMIGTLLTFALYFLGRAANLSEKKALVGALAFAFSPLGFYLSFAATTDGGAILFLTLALIPIFSALAEKREISYVGVALLIACGALYKWSVYLFWPLLFASLFFFPRLRKRTILGGLLISLLGLLPALYWNMTHEWATFKHVFFTLFKGSQKNNGGNFISYLGMQVVLFSPLFFATLLYGIKKLYKSESSPLHFLLFFVGAGSFFLFLSFFKKMQPNWALLLYPPLMLLVGWVLAERRKILRIAFFVSIVGIMGAMTIPHIQAKTALPLSYKANPFRQNMGARELTSLLEEVGYKSEKDFLFSDKYQNVSLLSFYCGEAYFFNLRGARKNQFSYWPQMDERERGHQGFFVVIENENHEQMDAYLECYKQQLAPYFTSIECVGKRALFSARGIGVKHALVFKCHNYLGGMPLDSELY